MANEETIRKTLEALGVTGEQTKGLLAVLEKSGLITDHVSGNFSVEGNLSSLPDTGMPPRKTMFVCPQGDYVWFRDFVSAPVPPCPTHKIKLNEV